MTKIKKSFLSIIFAMLFVSLLGFATLYNSGTTARADEITASDFTVGISVRIGDELHNTGVRFTVRIEKDKFETLMTAGKLNDGVSTGVLVTSNAIAKNLEDGLVKKYVYDKDDDTTVAGVYDLDTTTRWEISEEAPDYYESSVAIYDVPAASANVNLAIRPYIVYGGETVYKAEPFVKNMADAVLNDTSDNKAALTATYITANEYIVTYYDKSGTAIENGTETKYYGDTIASAKVSAPSETGYTFDAWKNEAGTSTWTFGTTKVTGNVNLYAKYTATEYTATINRANGSAEQVTFTIENRAAVLAGITLTADTDEWDYSWAEDLPEVLALNNTQVFTETRAKQTYVITWKNEDGTTLETDPAVEYGATPSCGTAPTKATTADNYYTFAGWTPAVTSVTSNATYTATYTSKATFSMTQSTESTMNIENNDNYFDTIELYINDRKVENDISDDIVDGVYDLAAAGYCGEDYYFKAKLVAVKDETDFTSQDELFQHLSTGVQVSYNPDGIEGGGGNPDAKAFIIAIDNSKFDDNTTSVEWVNVTLEMKGKIDKNTSGSSATGGMYIRAYDWEVNNGKITTTDFTPLNNGASWFNVYSAEDWTEVSVRVPKRWTNDDIYLLPFAYPNGFPITVFVRNISIDYETITTSKDNPVLTAYNANGAQHKKTTNSAGCSGIWVDLDSSYFDNDNATTEYVNVTMKLKGSVVGDITGTGYLDVATWGVGNGYIATGNYIISGASSWNEIMTSSEWMEVTLRLPNTYNIGKIIISPFFYPGNNVCTLEGMLIAVDYETVTTSSDNPILTAYNANGAQHKKTNNSAGCSGIWVNLDSSYFDNDNATTEYVNVTMKLKGSVVGNITGTGYLDVATWGLGNGYLGGSNYIISGASSWNEIMTSSEWMEVTLRLPNTYNIGKIIISVFFYPGNNVCTLEAIIVSVDYTTVSTSSSWTA